MASCVTDNSTEAVAETTEQIRFRRSRNQNQNQPISPNLQVSSLLQPTRCKPTISSLFLSTFTTNGSNTMTSSSNDSSTMKHNKKKNFTSATLRGLGCATSSQVSAPEVIRSSADWQAKKARKKKQRKNHQPPSTTPVVVVPDVWCTPGIGFAADAASVDCVVSRRPVQGRPRAADAAGERFIHRERSCAVRRVNNLEHISLLESPLDFETTRSDLYGARHLRHFRHHSPEGFAEIMMFQSSLLMGGRSDGFDRYRDWRLDVDNMSYEELVELGDRIGCVNTGLREDEIVRCLRKTKHAILATTPPSQHFPAEMEWKCTICQEEYEGNEEMGKLDCGHSYHTYCIKQWLLQKNTCPVCKVAASA